MNNVDDLLQLIANYENNCQQYLVKFAKIRKLPNGKYRVLSEKNKSLGTYKTKSEAVKRLRQVEYYKHHDKSDAKDNKILDLTTIDEFAYSAIMRKIRQEGSPQQIKTFLKLFKVYFDKAVQSNKNAPERIALQNTVNKFSKIYKIKLDKEMIKNAAIAELGNPELVGKYLSSIVKFIINSLPIDKQPHALDVLRQKFSNLNELDIASKSLPQAASYGQAITFVKHVLFNQDAAYVRKVLDSLVSSL